MLAVIFGSFFFFSFLTSIDSFHSWLCYGVTNCLWCICLSQFHSLKSAWGSMTGFKKKIKWLGQGQQKGNLIPTLCPGWGLGAFFGSDNFLRVQFSAEDLVWNCLYRVIIIIIIIKVFLKRKILSLETILSAYVYTRAHTHARAHTHTYIQRHPHTQTFWLYKTKYTQLKMGSKHPGYLE